MLNINIMKRVNKNEAGFTFIELLIASAMSLIVLGLLAHVFRSQQKEFDTQTVLNTMQANGRGATEFISRSVQNAGFNVKRGTRFLSASDHFITAVYDANNDNVIQNDEVITYALANTWGGTANETHTFTAWFDVDNDGTIDSTESRVINVGMNVTGPPFNLYKVTPNAAGTNVERSLIARNIDNMVIKYYDNQRRLLPWFTDTDNDGIGNIAFNNDADDQPDAGLWTFRIPINELNNIRKVEIELLARSRQPSPRGAVSTGTYLPGSLAAVTSGSVNYSDLFNREDYTTRMAPRNLTMSPWGNIDIVANPATVNCPGAGSITATLLNGNGEAVASNALAFTATGTGITLGSPSGNTDSNGEIVTTVNFDYSTPFLTSTVSASAQVDDGSGNLRPVYNATPVGFTFGGANFIEPFDGSQVQPWTDLAAGVGFSIPGGQEYFTADADVFTGTINGCAPWQDYVLQSNISHIGSDLLAGHEYGLILRHQDVDNYYYVRVYRVASFYVLDIRRNVAGTFSAPIASTGLTYNVAGTLNTYTLKAQIQGSDIKIKFWEPADPNDPNNDEPPLWSLEVTDATFASGTFGLAANRTYMQFDDVSLENAPPVF